MSLKASDESKPLWYKEVILALKRTRFSLLLRGETVWVSLEAIVKNAVRKLQNSVWFCSNLPKFAGL